MGLDSYWKDTDSSAPPMETRPNLCGGLFSGTGVTSFRGKVYDPLVRQVTGVSLYQEMIPNKTIQEMAVKLRSFLNEHKGRIIVFPDGSGYSISSTEVDDLVRMFEYHARHGSTLHGWW